jgi:hypothetical protein
MERHAATRRLKHLAHTAVTMASSCDRLSAAATNPTNGPPSNVRVTWTNLSRSLPNSRTRRSMSFQTTLRLSGWT